VKSVLLYDCETWKVTQRITNTLQGFINCCSRCIVNIRWPEIISNEDLWKITIPQPIEIQIKRRKLRWIGHTLRKPAGSIDKSVLDWNYYGARSRGYPKKFGKGRLWMKPWKRGRLGARLKDWLLTAPGGGVSRMPYSPEGATGVKKKKTLYL
jgi:hypothetical protein